MDKNLLLLLKMLAGLKGLGSRAQAEPGGWRTVREPDNPYAGGYGYGYNVPPTDNNINRVVGPSFNRAMQDYGRYYSPSQQKQIAQYGDVMDTARRGTPLADAQRAQMYNSGVMAPMGRDMIAETFNLNRVGPQESLADVYESQARDRGGIFNRSENYHSNETGWDPWGKTNQVPYAPYVAPGSDAKLSGYFQAQPPTMTTDYWNQGTPTEPQGYGSYRGLGAYDPYNSRWEYGG